MSSYFARNESNQLVHISEVTRGLACGCKCVVCGEPLVAKQGAVREHHFAHSSGLEPCFANHESLLHLYAKQVIQEAGGLTVPLTKAAARALGLPHSNLPIRIGLTRVDVEKTIGDIRPDLLVYTDQGIAAAIEVAYTSFCDPSKVAQFAAADLPALEIDLQAFTPEGFDPESVRASVLDAIDRKAWLWPEDKEATSSSLGIEAPVTPEAAATRIHLPEEIVEISGRWVAIKTFPGGDIAVKAVSFDPDLVSMIRSLAKENHGYFKPRYKNWIIPRWRAESVRTRLRALSTNVSIVLNDRSVSDSDSRPAGR